LVIRGVSLFKQRRVPLSYWLFLCRLTKSSNALRIVSLTVSSSRLAIFDSSANVFSLMRTAVSFFTMPRVYHKRDTR
jgi:hypothetical protein